MQRRSFLSLLSGAASALVAGVRGTPVAAPVVEPVFRGVLVPYPAAAAPTVKYVLNPAWVSAPYRETLLMGKGVAELMVVRQPSTDPWDALVAPDGFTFVPDERDPYPLRYELENGVWIPVYPFIPATGPVFSLP